jgi:hypothetical protein
MNLTFNKYQTQLTPEILDSLDKYVRDELLEVLDKIELIQNIVSPNRKHAKDLPRDNDGKIIVDITNPHILEDMDYFRQPVIHFQEHGCYSFAHPSRHPKSEFQTFWKEQTRRCKEGYVRESDGEWITGYNYFYWNFSPILKAVIKGDIDENEEIKEIKAIEESYSTAERIEGFPDPWDGDYLYYHYLDQAQKNGKYGAVTKTRGRGYEQPYSAIIKTPYGETTMGAIKPGDKVLTPTTNLYATVLEKYEQGVKDVYEVEFSDGRKVECGLNHLWAVYEGRGRKKRPYKVVSLEYILNKGLYKTTNQNQKSYTFKLPKIHVVEYPEQKELPVHPYVLGALLGDGSMSTGSIKIATSDVEIVKSFENILGSQYELMYDDTTTNNYRIVYKAARKDFVKINPLKNAIIDLNLNVSCKHKFIPEIYKTASVYDRMALVKGLMDTDGSISEKGFIEFTNTCEQLIDDLADVLRSLGIQCKKSLSVRTGSSIIEEREIVRNNYFRLYIKTNFNVFSLPRKSKRVRKKNIFDLVFIRNIKKIRREQSACILIDSEEHVYLTNDFIPTHNSFKGGSFLNVPYHFTPKSKAWAFASEKGDLTDDGLLSKAWDNMAFISEFTPWRKSRHEKDTVMHKKASYKDMSTGNFRGYKSEIIGLTTKNNPERARGKRGQVILYEEAGRYSDLLTAWNIARPSMEQGRAVFGLMVAYGTGGTFTTASYGLEKLFYQGAGYRVYTTKNVYDKVKTNNTCAFYSPEYLNRHGCYDKNGNSDVIKALIEIFQGRLEVIRNTSDPMAITQEKADRSITPQEAFAKVSGSVFPIDDLKDYLSEIIVNQESFTSAHSIGRLKVSENGIEFINDRNKYPIYDYPLSEKSDKEGAVQIYAHPVKINGEVTKYRYISGLDPVDDDYSSTNSLPSIFIFDTFTDNIVAEYTGRPNTANEFYEIALRLIEYYNAICNYESDKKGLFAYFSNKNKLYLLADNPKILKDMDMSASKENYGNKAHPYSEKIYTPNGIKLWKDIKIGDILFGSNGETTKVIDIPFDSVTDVYKITLKDGRKIKASLNHLWKVIDWSKKEKILSTQDLLKNYYRTKGKYKEYKYYIPIQKAVEYPEQEVQIEPYLLGLMLGDGCMTNSRHHQFCFASSIKDMDFYKTLIPFEIKTLDDRHHRIVIKNIGKTLKSLNLQETKSRTKFIPDIYKYNSFEVRLNILQGLLDTDGTVGYGGNPQFCSTSKQLAEDVMEVARSLGVNCNVNITNNKFGKIYNVRFYTDLKLFKLKRKADLQKITKKRAYKTAIVNIEYVGEEKSKCVTVDSKDSCYLINEYVITHNSKGTHSNKRVNQWGRRLQADWLIADYKTSDDKTIPNLRRVQSIAYLKELIAWHEDINADRVSAMGMCMILREEYRKYSDSAKSDTLDNSLEMDPYFIKNLPNYKKTQLKYLTR